MSYCRWSSDNFRCDLYCYEDVRGGWTTQVAGSRYIGGPPEYNNLEQFYRDGKSEFIGLPYDGMQFNDSTLAAFRERLLHLREVGYQFPDYVIEMVDEEMKEGHCTVGRGGPYQIAKSGLEPGCEYPWHILWLPKGYAPTHNDYCICLIAKPPDEDWSEFGVKRGKRPPLIDAICEAIEKHMKNRGPLTIDPPQP